MIREFRNINLADRNSFHVVQQAATLVEFDEATDLPLIFERYQPTEWMVLSGGNNILFTQDYAGLLITPVSERIELLATEGDEVVVRADAGVEWDDLVAWAVERDLWGLENLSLIPGKVGAAPVQNIGAYGAEAKDAILRVHLYDAATHTQRTLENAECAFGYRESIFKGALKGKVIITAVDFTLSTTASPSLRYGDVQQQVEERGGATLRNIREAVCSIRQTKLPDTSVLGNAGSFFKNPIVPCAVAESLQQENEGMPIYPASNDSLRKLAAGWLIDKAGLKGLRMGKVGVHDRQALVLVNHGGATGGDVMALARYVQAKVKEKFGIEIETEVNIW